MSRTGPPVRMCLFWMTCATCLVFSVSSAAAVSLYGALDKGKQLYDQEKYDKALETFLDAQIDHPENPKLKFNIASAQYKMNNYEDAVKGFMDVVTTAQDAQLEEQALYNIGNAKYRQGKLQEAVEYYKKALEINPEDEQARKNLEFVREEIKRRMKDAEKTKKQCSCNKNQQQQQTAQQQNQQQGRSQHQKKKEDGSDGKEHEQRSAQQQQQQKGGTQQQAGAQPDKEKRQQAGRKAAAADRKMSKEEAEQWLGALSENRDTFKKDTQRQRGSGARYGTDKPW